MAADGSVVIEITADADEFESSLKGVGKTAESGFAGLGRVIKGVLGALAVKEIAGAVYEIGTAFESSFAQVETIMDTTQVSVDEMKSSIRDLSKETGVSAAELSGTVYNAISATGDTAHAVSLVSDATKLATAGFTDTDSALSVLTTTMNAYHMSAEEAASISDSLIMTQNLGVTTIDQLAGSMGKAIATASAYNVDLHNLESAYISLTKSGISTEESTTYLSSMLKELGDSGSQVGKILQEQTGKSFGQLMEEGQSLGDVMGILMDTVNGDAEALMNLWGSAEAGKAANAIASQGLEEFNQNLNKVRNSAGTTEEAYNVMADTLEHKTQVLKSEVQDLAISIYESAKPMLSNLAEWATNFVRSLDPDAVVAAVTRIAKALAAAVAAFTAYKTAMAVKSVASGVVSALNPVINAVGNLSLGTKQGQVAWKVLSAAMQAAPIAAVAAGTLGVVGAMAALAIVLDDDADGSRALRQEIDALSESIDDQKQAQEEAAATRAANLSGVNAEISQTQKYIGELKSLTDANGKIKEGYEDRAAYLAGQINSVLPGAISLTRDESGAYAELADSIDEVIFAKKKEMALEAMREEYTAAIEGQTEANKKLVEATEKRAEAQRQLNEAIANDKGDERSGAKINQLTQNLQEADQAYNDALQGALDFQNTINQFDAVAAAGNMDALTAALRGLSDETVTFNGTNAEAVAQATTSNVNAYRSMVETAASSWDTMSASEQANWAGMIRVAQDAMVQQLAAFRETGQQIPPELLAGLQATSSLLPEGMRQMIGQTEAAALEGGDGFTTAGELYDTLVALGILSNAGEPEAAAAETAEAASAAAEGAADGSPAGDKLTDSMGASIQSGSGEVASAATAAAEGANSAAEGAASGNAAGSSMVSKMASDITGGAGSVISAAASAAQQANSAADSAASTATAGDTVISKITSSIQSKASALAAQAGAAINQATAKAKAAAEKGTEVGSTLSTSTGKGVTSKAGTIATAMTSAVNSAVSAGKGASAGASSIGAAIASGVAGGIRSGAAAAISAAVSMAKSALSAAKAALGIASPSKEFYEIGVMVCKGMANGVLSSAHFAEEAVTIMAGTVKAAVKDLNDEIEEIEAKAAERAAERELADHEKSLRDKHKALEKAETEYEEKRQAKQEELNKAAAKDRQKLQKELTKLEEDWLEDREKTLEDIARLEADWEEKQLQKQEAAQKKALQSRINALETLAKEYEKTVDEVEKERDDHLNDLARQQESVYSRLADRDLFRRDQYNNKLKLLDLQPAIDEINRYEEVLTGLKERGIDESLMGEILGMNSKDAVEFGQALLKMGDDQYDAYMAKWAEKEAASKRVAENLYAGEVQAAQEAYGAVLNSLEEEYLAQLPDDLGETGKESMDSFNEALEDGFQRSIQLTQQFRQDIQAELAQIDAAGTLKDQILSESARFSAALAGSSGSGREARNAAQSSDILQLAGAIGSVVAATANPEREVVLNVNGKEFARATIGDYRSVEDQSPRIVSDKR